MAAGAQVKPGDVLGGKYRVERVLGAGGMGMVVAARHIQLGQRVALKFMLKEALSDPQNAERFAREARTAVRLQSQHTARVLDVGNLKNGEPYMVMEYLDGQDLDEVLRASGPMPPHVAVEYILQACEAFAEAHALGMIHRDIKLKNLFLAKTVDGRPLVKVLDFGLAKTVGALGDVSLTATSAVFGSPQYMSPEQMRSAKDVDTRSDIWSIGVSLYELLTSRVPFDAPGVAEICAMVLKDPVEPPSRWAMGLPRELDDIIVKCLAKDPRERYQTVAELAHALEPWSATQGSARRILHVMTAVQKTDMPTLMDGVPAQEIDTSAKTMDAWDSGERARQSTRRGQRIVWAIGACVSLALLGSIFGVVAISKRSSSKATASSAMVEPSAAASLGDAPTGVAPATTVIPGLIGASPIPAAVSAHAAEPAAPVSPSPPGEREPAAAAGATVAPVITPPPPPTVAKAPAHAPTAPPTAKSTSTAKPTAVVTPPKPATSAKAVPSAMNHL